MKLNAYNTSLGFATDQIENFPLQSYHVIHLQLKKMSVHANNSTTAEFLTTNYFKASFNQSYNPWVQNLKSAAIFTFKSHLIPFLLSTAKCPLLFFKCTAAEPSNILSTVKSFFIHLKTFNITVQPFLKNSKVLKNKVFV